MTYKVLKINDNVLVYDVDTPDDKMEFMDSIDARPGDTFRFTYNGWLEYLGNEFDQIIDSSKQDAEANELLKTLREASS